MLGQGGDGGYLADYWRVWKQDITDIECGGAIDRGIGEEEAESETKERGGGLKMRKWGPRMDIVDRESST